MTKLKKLKLLIKEWAAHQFRSVEHSMASLLQEIQELHNKEELGNLSSEEFSNLGLVCHFTSIVKVK